MRKEQQHTPIPAVAAEGGNASAHGTGSEAKGGDAGQRSAGPGGRGGHAHVFGNYSRAEGGRGGRGGVGPGGPGGDVVVLGDGIFSAGGDGGEASQADGRGGRGGMPHSAALAMLSKVGIDIKRAHMRAPYWLPNTIPGSGGHGSDTVQYLARRLVIEELKLRYFTEVGRNAGRVDIWYDRVVVPLDWLNEQLSANGHLWTAKIVDFEYEFSDSCRTT